jgi:hypothetical protein
MFIQILHNVQTYSAVGQEKVYRFFGVRILGWRRDPVGVELEWDVLHWSCHFWNRHWYSVHGRAALYL